MTGGNWFGLGVDPATARADLVIFGIPFDRAVFFRQGAAAGPDRLRELSRQLPPSSELLESLAGASVLDLGNVSDDDDVAALYERAAVRFAEARARGLPMALGGDHSVSIPLFAAAADWAQSDMGIIWIDAHPDLCDTFDGSPYSHACVLRRALDHPHTSPQNTVLLGTRSCEIEELEYIGSHPLTVLSAQHLAGQDPFEVGAALLHRFGSMPVYLSIDIDCFDPAYAPGTGIPDAGGLTSRWVLDLVHALRGINVIAADLVEIAPSLDAPSEPTTLLGLKLILEILANQMDGQR